ncbi:hypothetical protein AwMethylo_04200 [Methylobacterium sp.]|nr:hypothetical protein AwMethylo_04200 [Methylobacterium sp.]
MTRSTSSYWRIIRRLTLPSPPAPSEVRAGPNLPRRPGSAMVGPAANGSAALGADPDRLSRLRERRRGRGLLALVVCLDRRG